MELHFDDLLNHNRKITLQNDEGNQAEDSKEKAQTY